MSEKTKQLEKPRKALSAPGLRMTTQRILIMNIIRHGQGHLDANEVYRQARRKHPRISLSTVYRNLHMLKKIGLIEELHFNEEHHHYEIKQPGEHHHLACINCGTIIEFQYPLARLIERNVPEIENCKIRDIELRMTGYCPECCQKNE